MEMSTNLTQEDGKESARARAIPFVTALLAIPLVSHPGRNVCPGYPRGTASLLGHHRFHDHGQFFNFFGSPSACVA